MRRYTEEEGSRAVELFFEGNMAQQQVVDKLGFPTRQCLERWLSADSRYRDQNFKKGVPPCGLEARCGAPGYGRRGAEARRGSRDEARGPGLQSVQKPHRRRSVFHKHKVS